MKEGDRVKFGNKEGVIIGFHKESGSPLVEFDKEGAYYHDGYGDTTNGKRSKPKHGWYCSESDLELINTKQQKDGGNMKFKVGDRIKLVKKERYYFNDKTLKQGDIVTISYVEKDGSYAFKEDHDEHEDPHGSVWLNVDENFVLVDRETPKSKKPTVKSETVDMDKLRTDLYNSLM